MCTVVVMYNRNLLIGLCCTGFVTLCSGFIMPDREYSKILSVSNGGEYGDWGEPEFCPLGTYASGYSMKVEVNQLFGDDTALNAIRLLCSGRDGRHNATFVMTSASGPYGIWSKEVMCKQDIGQPLFMTSFKLQVEPPQGDGDDTSANYVNFRCRAFDGTDGSSNTNNTNNLLTLWPGHGNWGSWSGWSDSCDPDRAICGLRTKIQGSQGSGDDTGLNDVKFYCCM